ncbi:unnamed protein product [Hymenolepis diminuta]|nr:unnamed protein product [Hymenolepis diminuta]
MTYHPSTEGTHSPSHEYQKQSLPRIPICDERRYHRDCCIEYVAVRIAKTMATKKASTENLQQTVQRGRTRTTRKH